VTAPGLAGSGAKAGPLLIRDFPEGSTDATIHHWAPPGIEKVLIRQVQTSADLIVRGARCADGHALRFCYDPCGFPSRFAESTPIPKDVLDTMGDSVLHLAAFEQRTPSEEKDHPGYILFTSDGDWRIDLWDLNGANLGSTVLRVTTAP
jgi:hypothetical protein